MFQFEFHNPVRVFFGAGQLSIAGKEAAKLGKRALLVSYQDQDALRATLDRLRALLAAEGVTMTEFFEVAPNPDILMVEQGVALAKRAGVDFVVGVGGGSKSALWRGILADVFGLRIVKTNVDQQAAALGAAALAAVGVGLWKDFEPMVDCHRCKSTIDPDPARAKLYEQLLPVFTAAADDLARHGQRISQTMT